MEILLLEDVAGIGKKNDLLVVGDGFALNCLLPQRKALVATPTVRKRYADQIKKRAEEKEREKQVAQSAVAMLQNKSVMFSRKATKTGKLYAAITQENISEAMQRQHDITIKFDDIVIAEPIKSVGSTQVQIKMGTVTHPLTVVVTEEKTVEKK